MNEQKKAEFALPLGIDTQAYQVLNEGIVLDAKRRVVATFDTIEEAKDWLVKQA